jgi:hypothetical protein
MNNYCYEDPAAETAGRQKTMDVTLWQRPQGVKKLSING